MNESGRLAILGAGSWGTALAVVLAPNFGEVRLWAHREAAAEAICRLGENAQYLPGVRLPGSVRVSHHAGWCLESPEIVLIAIPSQFLRGTMAGLRAYLPQSVPLVSAIKGLEPETRLRMSELISSAAGVGARDVFALSGPSFALEAAKKHPTAVVLAGELGEARRIQSRLSTPTFRVYSTEDLVGVELGGALKNVIAIASGLAIGIGLGHNALAALITRGLAEMTRLAVAMGAQPRTLAGLSGLGDLVLTCTSEASRNRRLGISLTKASSVPEALKNSSLTTEGVRTAAVAVELGARHFCEIPIAQATLRVLSSVQSPSEALRNLMDRSLKEE